MPIATQTPASAAPGTAPPGFPSAIRLCRQIYQNWDGAIQADALWTCVPRTAAEVVEVANWARQQGYTVRAVGYRHNWSPLTVAAGTSAAATKVVLVDTTQHLTALRIESADPATVRVQTGASMEALLTYLERHGYGVTATPAPGDVSVGGVLAIGGHGSAVPAKGEVRQPGHSFGSLSNMVVSLTAVVWDAGSGRYVERTFHRSDPDCKAFLTHLGRAFLTEVTLRVGANYSLRCVNHTDIPATELFAAPAKAGARSLTRLLDQAGRVGVIWFAFTSHPWVQVWNVAPTCPPSSRRVSTPFNYPFADNIPEPIADLVGKIVKGASLLTPLYCQLQATATEAGLVATGATDMWGPSKNFLFYVKPTTVRVTAGSYAVHTSRASLQRVVSEFVTFYQRLLASYQARGQFPINEGVEIRVTGLDQPEDVGVPGAEAPALSVLRPRQDHPEWDVAVWLDVLTFPNTPGSHAFYRELEQFFTSNYTGSYAAARVEWSKRWAHTKHGAWQDRAVLTEQVPNSFRHGPNPSWDWAVATLNGYDPHRIFTNPLLDTLFS